MRFIIRYKRFSISTVMGNSTGTISAGRLAVRNIGRELSYSRLFGSFREHFRLGRVSFDPEYWWPWRRGAHRNGVQLRTQGSALMSIFKYQTHYATSPRQDLVLAYCMLPHDSLAIFQWMMDPSDCDQGAKLVSIVHAA